MWAIIYKPKRIARDFALPDSSRSVSIEANTPIGTRELRRSGGESPALVRLWTPKSEGQDTWSCSYEIAYSETAVFRQTAHGVDAFQALFSSFGWNPQEPERDCPRRFDVAWGL